MNETQMTTYEEMLLEDPRGLRQEELIVEVTEALARALRRPGLTQSELAQRLGKTKGFVSQILGGGRNLTLRTLADVADALGCTVQVQLKAQMRDPLLSEASDLEEAPQVRVVKRAAKPVSREPDPGRVKISAKMVEINGPGTSS